MRISRAKLEIALARQCKVLSDLRGGVSPQTLQRIQKGQDAKPRTIGKIARALGVPVEDLLEAEA